MFLIILGIFLILISIDVKVSEFNHSIVLENGGFYAYKIEENFKHKIKLMSERDIDIYLLTKNLNVLYHEKNNRFYIEIEPKEDLILSIFNNYTLSKIIISDSIYKRIDLKFSGIVSLALSILIFLLRKRKYIK